MQNREISPVLVGILISIIEMLFVCNLVEIGESIALDYVGLGGAMFLGRLFALSWLDDIGSRTKISIKTLSLYSVFLPVIGLAVAPFLGKGNETLKGTVYYEEGKPTYTDSSLRTNVVFCIYLAQSFLLLLLSWE